MQDSAQNPCPPELELLWLVDRFGWEAAHTAPVGEMRRMLAAENVYRAFNSRENYRDANNQANWEEWAGKHERLYEILNRAAKAAGESDVSKS